MIYTNLKRKELNEAFCRHYLGHQFHTNKDRDMHATAIWTDDLLPDACIVNSLSEITSMLHNSAKAWDNVVPVLIASNRMDEELKTLKTCYRVNYVNSSSQSLETASEYITSRKLYFIPGLTIDTHGK